MDGTTRRTLLVGSAGLLPALAGCRALRGLDAAAADEPGSLAIRNDDDRDHRVTVTVEHASEDPEDVPPAGANRTPTAELEPYRSATFEVAAGETLAEPGFVTDPGAYVVTAVLETGARATTWLGLRADRASGGGGGRGVVGAKLEVYVGRDADVTVAAPSAE